MKPIISIFLFLFALQSPVFCSVDDTLAKDDVCYELFKDKFIVYFDRGINAAPFDIMNDFNKGQPTLNYRNNVQPTLGFGIGYRGIGVRVGFALPVYLQPTETAGKTDYFDIGLKVNYKQLFFAGHVRKYKGYYIENVPEWNDSLASNNLKDIRPSLESFGVSLNLYYFKSKRFNYQCSNGILGHYQGRAGTWYFKATSNVFRIRDNEKGIIPAEMHDTIDVNNATEIGAIDLGLVPGFAFATRKRSWQFSFLIGLGGVVQNKYYKFDGRTPNEIFLAPRMDLKVITGISKPKFFVLLNMDFDIKSMTIDKLTYQQTFYNFQIATGLRFNTKKATKQTD